MKKELSLDKFNIDIKKKYFWLVVAALTVIKLILSSQQLIYASPELAPIDDTLMFNLANSISSGQWLGEYNYLTLSKHSFYALWLSFLNLLNINVVIGGQILYAAAALTATQAISPVMKNLPRLVFFAAVLYVPSSYCEFTLRVYRDNIYPSLVILALAALIGAYLRYKQPVEKTIGWLILSGASFGAAWLTHEDNALLLPFFICASAVYLFFVFKSKEIKYKWRCLAIVAVPVLVCLVCNLSWAYMNFTNYGRFIISDFTSTEFNDAMGSLSRINPKAQKRYCLVPNENRHMAYEISPSFALLKPYLENDNTYNSYGSVEDKEINSGGIHWAIRMAASKAGFYKDAQTAAQFYTAVATEINAACDDGRIPAGRKQSGVFAPFKGEYFTPTLEKLGESFATFMFFTQTRPSSEFSIATPEQSEEWESYLNVESTKSAIANTSDPYFAPLQKLAIFIFEAITLVYRVLIYPLLILCGLYCIKACKRLIFQIKNKALNAFSMADILMMGMFLTGLLRFAAIAYLSAVTMKIATLNVGVYIMYLAPAYAPIIAFVTFGAINALLGVKEEELV